MSDTVTTAKTGRGSLVVNLACPDRPGVVRTVLDYFFHHGCDVAEISQFSDPENGKLFMRVHLHAGGGTPPVDRLEAGFAPVAREFRMRYDLYDMTRPVRLLVMVSRLDHCLNDLLYRWRQGQLPVDIAAVVSNHPDLAPLAQRHGVPFYHIPVTPDTKPEAEARLLELVQAHDIELVVLARYMQILSDGVCKELDGRIINIHHSFLPSFKGANAYRQAYERGVKLIGATAHYVTPDLDEGPIIEQEVARVDHRTSVQDLAALGRDLEAQTLARAVLWHVQRRIILNGQRTVVFR